MIREINSTLVVVPDYRNKFISDIERHESVPYMATAAVNKLLVLSKV